MAHDTRSKGEFVARRPKSERRRIIIGWIIAIAVLLLLAGAVYFAGFSEESRVHSVTVSGNRITGETEIVKAVTENIASRSWVRRLVGENNILFWTNVKEISGDALQEPAIRSIAVDTDLIGRRALVNVREREFAGAWCAEYCVGFDESGIAYFNTPNLEGSLLRVIYDTGSAVPKLGERVLSDEQQFNNMMKTIRDVQEAGIAIERVEVKDHTLREWTITPSHGGAMLFSFDVVPERLGNVLKNIMERTKWDSLSYIDFRVANRVYYK